MRRSRNVAIGFASVTVLQEMREVARKLVSKGEQLDVALVLVENPSSNYLRPALIKVLP